MLSAKRMVQTCESMTWISDQHHTGLWQAAADEYYLLLIIKDTQKDHIEHWP